MRIRSLVRHLFRLVASALGVMLCAAHGEGLWQLAAVVFAALGFMAAFALTHDLAHAALRLPKGLNEVLLALAGALYFTSGHAMRRSHAKHHRSPLSVDDAEGYPARGSLLRAVLCAPLDFLAVRIGGYRLAPARERGWIVLESALNLLSLWALWRFGGAAGELYAAVGLGLQLSMGVWASFIPHRAPESVLSLARRLSFLKSPVVLSLAYHELHHQQPRVPCDELHYAAGLQKEAA